MLQINFISSSYRGFFNLLGFLGLSGFFGRLSLCYHGPPMNKKPFDLAQGTSVTQARAHKKRKWWWVGLLTVSSWADPVLLLPGDILPPGKGELRVGFGMTDFTKLHDGAAAAKDFAAGETRRLTLIPFMARYALGGKEEILVKSSYLDQTHRTSGGTYGKTGFGDTMILVRNYANFWGDLRGALAIGVNIPTGRSVFDAGANELATGDGTWDGVASFAWVDSRQAVMFHAEVTYFLRAPRTMSKVLGTALTEEVRVGFTHRFQFGISMEMKATDSLTFFGEMVGRTQLGQTGSYAASTADPAPEVNAKAVPEFGLQYQDGLWLAPLAQVALTPTLSLAAGAVFPLRVTTGYGGLTYLVSGSTKF